MGRRSPKIRREVQQGFRNNPLAITISTEAEGRYFDVNEAFLDLLGHRRKDVIGRATAELDFWAEPLDRGGAANWWNAVLRTATRGPA